MTQALRSTVDTFFELAHEYALPVRSPMGNTVSFGPGTKNYRPCPECKQGRAENINWQASVHIIGAEATMWKDVIGGIYSLYSTKVIRDLESIRAKGFTAHKVQMRSIESDVLRSIPPPDYYLLEVTSQVAVNRDLFDENEGSMCSTCGKWVYKPGGKYGRFNDKVIVIQTESWDGGDVVRLNTGSGLRYCTKRVVDLAIERQWVGFGIRPCSPDLPRIDLTKPDWFEVFQSRARQTYPEFVHVGP